MLVTLSYFGRRVAGGSAVESAIALGSQSLKSTINQNQLMFAIKGLEIRGRGKASFCNQMRSLLNAFGIKVWTPATRKLW
jgi:hypothetical protein